MIIVLDIFVVFVVVDVCVIFEIEIIFELFIRNFLIIYVNFDKIIILYLVE